MDTPTETVPCPGDKCGKMLRFPSDRGRLKVTCPQCKTVWEWSPPGLHAQAAPTVEAAPTFDDAQAVKSERMYLVALQASAAVLVCGALNRAWMPTLLFLLTALAWWACRRIASAGGEGGLWRKGSAALWEATASTAGGAAIGFAAVIALITFLNGYAGLTPSRYPSWLPAMESGLVGISAWLQDAENKKLMAAVYVVLIVSSVVAVVWARRYEKRLTPVKTLSNWKQLVTKAAVAIQAFTLFTFFSQAPINEHALELEQQLRWRYGVAKRAEHELGNKRLLAEQLKEAARDPRRSQEDKDDFIRPIADLRSNFRPPAAPPAAPPATPPPPPGDPSGPPPPPPPDDPPPTRPFDWHPPSWPHPPAPVRDKLDKGQPLGPDDYRPSSAKTRSEPPVETASDESAPPKKAEPGGRDSWLSKADAVVSKQLEDAKPPAGDEVPAPGQLPADPAEGMVWPIKTVDDWEKAKGQVAAQEAKADRAEGLYGQALHGAAEVVCEAIGLQINAAPLVEAWADLLIDNVADRARGYVLSAEPSLLSRFTTQFRRLFTPRENAAEKLAAEARARIGAADYEGAERLVGDLIVKYPKTKAGKEARGLAEECSFERARRNYENGSWDNTISECSNYLDDHYDSRRSGQVRQWLKVTKQRQAADEADAKTPRMIVYVKEGCGNSKYFLRQTIRNPSVSSAVGGVHYDLRDYDASMPWQQSKIFGGQRQVVFPVVIFESRTGALLARTEGLAATTPGRLLSTMREAREALASGRYIFRLSDYVGPLD